MMFYLLIGIIYIIAIISISIILVIYYIIKKRAEYFSTDNMVLILTSTVNVDKNMGAVTQKRKKDRIQTYEKSVNSWINNSPFKIILVENSGYEFKNLPENSRLEIITYKPTGNEKKLLDNHRDKGSHELHAIKHAIDNSKIIQKISDGFIIKITGRYYIPNFDKILKDTITKSTEFITQNNRSQCEIFGCKLHHANTLFKFKIFDFMENHAHSLIDKLGTENTITKLPPISIEPTIPGCGNSCGRPEFITEL